LKFEPIAAVFLRRPGDRHLDVRDVGDVVEHVALPLALGGRNEARLEQEIVGLVSIDPLAFDRVATTENRHHKRSRGEA
jgi:hypothetical protein